MSVAFLPAARDDAGRTAGVLIAGLLAALLLVAAPLAGSAALVGAGGVIALGGAFWLSGNVRLLALWGLVATAPIGLGKRFVPVPHMGGASAFAIEVSDVFLALLAFFLLRDLLAGRRRGIRVPLAAWCWAGLMLVGVVSVATGPLRMLALLQVVQMGKELLFFLVLVNELVRARQFEQVATALALTVAGQALIGAAEFARGGGIGLGALGEASDETLRYAAMATYVDGSAGPFRIGALLGHPNLFAGFLALTLPVLLAALMTPMAAWRRALAAGALLGGLAALVLTLSRSGWIAFGLAFVAVMAASLLHPRLRGRYVTLRAAALGALALGALAAAPQILRRLYESDPGALNFRYEWMDVAFAFVRAHPVLGIGLNSFVFHLPGATRFGDAAGLRARFGDVWPVVHNIWLIVWSEQGTAGFVLFVATYAALFGAAIRNARVLIDERLYLLSIGAGAGLLATAIDGFGSFFLRNPQCARPFWLVAAIVVAVGYWNRANAHLAGLALVERTR